VHAYNSEKVRYWGRIVNTAARATKKAWAGRRGCIDLFAAEGFNRDVDTGELSWGSPLLALSVDDPFDFYFFNDADPDAAHTLAERIADPHLFGLSVFALDIGSESAGAQARQIKGQLPLGPKVIVSTGDANETPVFVKMLLPAWEQRRYSIALIDPPGLDFTWDALGVLTLNERLDLLMLFAEDMDLQRNLGLYLGPSDNKADRYFPYGWRDVALKAMPREGPALRQFYKAKLAAQLGYEHTAEFDPVIRNAKRSELYKLIFASKHKFGLKIWDEVNGPGTDPQLAFPFGFI
jgi:three-Cys-motif partner protein